MHSRHHLRCLLPLVFILGLAPFARASVTITEFVASNSTGLQDENGDYSDWLEIFNSDTDTVNLDGWFVTDTAGDLTKWRFPATNLPPASFMVVFCSGKNRAVAGAPLHTNFKLDAAGEYLALVMPDGVTIASEFSPQFPPQYQNISYGIGQSVATTRFISNTSPAMLLIPANGSLANTWISNSFDDSSWRRATNGLGYENLVPGFSVRNIRANVSVCDISAADTVLATPSQQAAVFIETRPTVNFMNTGGGGHFGSDTSFPGFVINVDENNFVTEVTGIITIPTSGNWTFGVNSDDGFRADIGSFTFSYPSPRSASDTLATFNLTAGTYPVRLIFYECSGGSSLEFFAAPGSLTSYSSAFRLVGDTANGGLLAQSLPVGSAGAAIKPLVLADVQAEMLGRASSAFIRIPFAVSDPSLYSTLTLRLKYNDGFVAWLNGSEVARRNAPGSPQWNSTATASRSVPDSVTFEDIDLTGQLNLLQAGANLLAIHGLNDSSNSPSFLILAELAENKILGLTNHYFTTPTPGAANNSEFYAAVDNLKFTPGRGWFGLTNLSVSIASATPDVIIRYTTNGTIPSLTNGYTYTGPLPISSSVCLRAVGYRDGFEPTEPETHTYIFLDQVQRQSTNVNYVGGSAGDYTLSTAITQNPAYQGAFQSNLVSIPTISIAIAWEDFFGPAGIWSNPTAAGIAWERACSVEYIRPDGEKGFQANCGIRVQGGVSRSAMLKRSLRFLFRKSYGLANLDYRLFQDASVEEFDTLVLHATFNDHWAWGGGAATLQRDLWCRDAQNAMGGYGCHGEFVHVYVNGLYWGVYNIGERGDASFAAHYLGGEKEEYDAFNPDGVVDGDATAWSTLFSITDAGITTDAAYTNLSQYVDIPNFIDYMLMNFYAANTDWPFHNWNAARHRVPGGGLHFFSWDAEWTFGIGNDINTDRTGITSGDGPPGRLYAALRVHPEFRRLFGDRVQKHCFNNGPLTPAAAQALWVKRENQLQGPVVCELARWGGGNMPSTWQNAESAVLTWFPQRTAILVNQLRNAGLYPQLSAPVFTQYGGLVPPGYPLVITNFNATGSIYYTLDGSDPRLWSAGLSPSARLYTGSLSLTNASVFRARIRDGTNWSALVEANFYVVQDYSSLIVSEIMYQPDLFGPYTSDDLEFLELKNTGTNIVDISGLYFTDGITFSFTNGTTLSPGQFFVLVRNPAAFAARYPGVTFNGLYTGKLDNGGEKLTLSHVLGTNAFSLRYDDKAPWPITPNGYGFSLVRANYAGDPDDPTSWRPSANLGGSPGADDPPSLIPPIVIDELLARPIQPQPAAIELFNPTSNEVALGGWFLTDDPAEPKKFRIPEGTNIAAGGFVVFTEADFNPEPNWPFGFNLNPLGGSLYLFSGDASNNLSGYSHSFQYGASEMGLSLGRYVNSLGEENWPVQTDVTLGQPSTGPRVGPIVINEIMYHPPIGYDEFIELYNNSDAPVPLYDPALPTNGWKLDGIGWTFTNNIILNAASYLLLVPIDPLQFRVKYNVSWSVQILGPYPGLLQDSGERLRLDKPDAPYNNTYGIASIPYVVVDEVRYNDKLPWPIAADGDGPSLQRFAPTVFGNEPTNWFASGITPGLPNTFNQAPLCAMLSPANGSTFTFPANILLSASASDLDGQLVRVEFYDGEIKLGEVVTAPYSILWANAPAGTHTIIAKARDNRLAVTASSPITITVNPPAIGTGVGLSADYYDNINFTGTLVHRTDPVVNFDWGGGSPAPGIDPDTFSVRWLGQVQPRFSETYTFYGTADDGIRLWVNNQPLIDRWIDQGPTEYSGSIQLQAGLLYDIRMEMYENGGGAVAQLRWSSPSVSKEIIPSTQLYLPAPSNLPPVVTLTSPATGSVYVANSRIDFTATALDPDGSIAKVEFYANDIKLGEMSAPPFNFSSSNLPPGAFDLRAVGVDNVGTRGSSAPVHIAVLAGFTTNITLIPTGAVWGYYDQGVDLGNAWSALGYNDLSWSNGPAQLGYGLGNEITVISYGPNPSAKFITAYFRSSFSLSDLSVLTGLRGRVLRDDGVIIYLNGSEVFRDNMPAGPVNYPTLATNDVSGADQSAWHTFPIDPGYLVLGNNVLAAEVHQFNAQSPDLAFDFELAAEQTYLAPYFTSQPSSQNVFEGDDVTLTAAAAGTEPISCQWSFNGVSLSGATNAALLLTNILSGQSGNYQVLLSNTVGTALSSNAVVTVRLPVRYAVVFTQQPEGALLRGSSSPATYGQTSSNYLFAIAVTGTQPIRFQWRKNGADIPGATNISLTLYNASIADEGAYTAVASNILGAVVSSPATLLVGVAPVVLQQPQSLTLPVGVSTNLAITVSGYPLPLGYRWKRDAYNVTNIIIPQTNSTLAFENIALTNSGAYSVVITNSAFSSPFAVSANAYLTVVAPPSNQVANVGANSTFTVSAQCGNYTSRLRYQWQFNGASISNQTNTSLTLTNVQLTHQGIYSLILTNPAGVPTSFPAQLTVIPAPDADSDGDGMPDPWELAYHLNPLSNLDANIDSDGDGLTNLQEYIAGTDPLDPQSYLRVGQISWSNSVCTLRFFAVSNRTYSILFRTNPVEETWSKLADTSAAPTNRLETITDASLTIGNRFYRLVTPAQP